MKKRKDIAKNKHEQDISEHALVLGLVALAVITALAALRANIVSLIQTMR